MHKKTFRNNVQIYVVGIFCVPYYKAIKYNYSSSKRLFSFYSSVLGVYR